MISRLTLLAFACAAVPSWQQEDGGLAAARELAAQLEETAGSEAYDTVAQRAFREFQVEVDALHFEAAEVLAETMHATANAGWSAVTLALFRTRRGKHDGARELLEAELQRAPDDAARRDLHVRLALALLGAGREPAARDQLARALLLGSPDACMVLGWMGLRRGHPERARALFRRLLPGPLDADPAQLLAPAPWALRGYGLASLPPPPAPPARGPR